MDTRSGCHLLSSIPLLTTTHTPLRISILVPALPICIGVIGLKYSLRTLFEIIRKYLLSCKKYIQTSLSKYMLSKIRLKILSKRLSKIRCFGKYLSEYLSKSRSKYLLSQIVSTIRSKILSKILCVFNVSFKVCFKVSFKVSVVEDDFKDTFIDTSKDTFVCCPKIDLNDSRNVPIDKNFRDVTYRTGVQSTGTF